MGFDFNKLVEKPHTLAIEPDEHYAIPEQAWQFTPEPPPHLGSQVKDIVFAAGAAAALVAIIYGIHSYYDGRKDKREALRRATLEKQNLAQQQGISR